MKNIEQAPSTAEEILEDLTLFHDPEKIQETLDLLLECYIASHVIDTHNRSEKEDIYSHVNKIKDLLDFVKMRDENKFMRK